MRIFFGFVFEFTVATKFPALEYLQIASARDSSYFGPLLVMQLLKKLEMLEKIEPATH